jgi:hypothetical protein
MGNGWQTISLTFDETEIGFLASYIGDCPLSSLITLVARIDASTEDEEETIKRHTEWYQEPGAIQFIVESDGTIDNITIKKTSQDVLCVVFDVEEMENPEETFHCQVRHKDLRNAVIAEATAMLKEFGIQGYNENWYYGLDNFPVASFLLLLGNKTSADEGGDIFTSRLDDEINLLKSIL